MDRFKSFFTRGNNVTEKKTSGATGAFLVKSATTNTFVTRTPYNFQTEITDLLKHKRCSTLVELGETIPAPEARVTARQSHIPIRPSTAPEYRVTAEDSSDAAFRELAVMPEHEVVKTPTISRSRPTIVHRYKSAPPVSPSKSRPKQDFVILLNRDTPDVCGNERPHIPHGRTQTGHVDLFDAVSVLSGHKRNLSLSKRTGSGLRDYGEDVADRNMRSLQSSGLEFYTDPKYKALADIQYNNRATNTSIRDLV